MGLLGSKVFFRLCYKSQSIFYIWSPSELKVKIMSFTNKEMYTELSGSQQLLLAILPIPSSICSVLGSSIIIFIALKSRRSKAWTPYNRLLLGMSICDIIFSITLGLSIFLLPKDSSSSSSVFVSSVSYLS